MRALRPAAVLGMFGAGVGIVSIVSALTPSLADRSDLVQGVLPPGVPGAARWLALAFGVALVWLSRSLARGKRRAWQLAVAVIAGAAVAHLAKGLDAEEGAASLVLLIALVRYRDEFDVDGDPSATRPLVVTAWALVSLGAFLILYELHKLSVPEDLEDLVSAVAALLSFRALSLWLRSWHLRERPSALDRALASRLVEEYGRDTLAFFALRRDKSYFFSPTRRFLARGPADPKGATVGQPSAPGWISPARARGTRGRPRAPRGTAARVRRMARKLARTRLHDGDGRPVRPPAHALRRRAARKRNGRRLPPPRAVPRLRGLLTQRHAAPSRHSERADGVPDRRSPRLDARAGRARDLAELLRVRRPAPRTGRPRARRACSEVRAPLSRSRLPARAAPQLHRQVLPRMAPALPLPGAAERLPACGDRLSPCRVAAHAADALGEAARRQGLAWLRTSIRRFPGRPRRRTRSGRPAAGP